MRLLLPHFSKSDETDARMTYGLKEIGLASMIISVRSDSEEGRTHELARLCTVACQASPTAQRNLP